MLIKGLTPQKLHNRQKLKIALTWVFYPISIFVVLIAVPKQWALPAIIGIGIVAPILFYNLFTIIQSRATLAIEPVSPASDRKTISINRIEDLVFKRSIYKSRKLFSIKRNKELYIVIDTLTIISNIADKNIGVLHALTDEEEVAFEKVLLPDNTALYTEYYAQFPAPETILVGSEEFKEICNTLSRESGKPITKLSGGNAD